MSALAEKPAPRRDSRRNLAAFIGDMSSFAVGMYFMPTTTVIVGLASMLTTDKALIGIVGLTWRTFWYLPQLLAARVIHHQPRKWPFLFWPAQMGRQIVLLLVAWLFFTQASNPGLTLALLIGGLAIFSSSDALASISWFDILSRAFTPRMRSRVFAIGQLIGSLVGIAVGIAVERLLANEAWPIFTRYAVVLLCGYLALNVSGIFILFIQELPPDSTGHEEGEAAPRAGFADTLRAAVQGDARFRRVLLGRGLTFLETMVSSFYVVFARAELGLGPEAIGLFSAAYVVGSIFGVVAFGALGERAGPRRVSQLASFLHFLAPALVVALIVLPGLAGSGLWVMFAVLGINGALEHSLTLGYLGYVMDIATDKTRGAYIAVMNSLSGIISLTPFLGGVLLDALALPLGARGAYAAVFGAVAVIVLIGSLVALTIPPVSRDPAPAD